MKDALNNITQYQYDANGNLIKVIDAKGNATSYTYDSLNRLTQIAYPDGTTESYQYWADGKLKQKTDGRGWKTYFYYDSVGRLMHKLYDNGTGVGYNYDAVGRLISEYDLTWQPTQSGYQITWTGNTITYQYDAVGRLTKKTLPNGRYISYNYDSAGRRVQMTDYFGGQTTYSYDALGRLTSLTNPFGEVTTFQYDANSRLIRKNLPNGTYTTYTYNSRGFLVGIANYKSNGTLITYANYTYDAVGNRLSMTTPEGTYSYIYDAIYRLTSEQNPISGTYTYTYDAVGNRLTMTHNGQTTNYTYDAGNKLLQAGSTTFTYDGNGNMISKTENGQTTTYVYNYEDKMVQVILPNNATINYTYDHEGKRIGKTANGTTIDYYFDGDDLIIEAQGTNILAYYTQAQGLISQRRGSNSYFYHYDGLGSTKALTDSNQNVQASYKYDAWGNILQTSGTITNPYLYVGELGYYGDGDAGMYLLTQRWYNPVVGRFSTRDRVGQSSIIFPFLYTINNPVNYVDPLGWDRCPTLDQLPSDAQQTLKSCFQKCTKESTAIVFSPAGYPTLVFNPEKFAKCFLKCVRGKVKELAIEYACCLWWKYVHGGEDATKDPWRTHPCSEEWASQSSDKCHTCCDFKWCRCIMHHAKGTWEILKGFIQCTLVGKKACYLGCDSCIQPTFPE